MLPGTLVDRVAGRPVTAGTTLPASLGRYAAVSDGPDRTVEYQHGTSDRPGRALPDPVMVDAVIAIGDRVARLASRGALLSELMDISPLVDDHAAQQTLSRQPLEDAIEEHLPYLRAVCFRPAARLRSTDQLLPVARVRTITPRSIVRLSAHSEDWSALRPDGVRPNRVLSRERELDIDLYENRIACRLVDELSRYLTLRAAQVRGIRGMFNDIQRYIDDIGGRHWQASQRLWTLVAELLDQEDWQEQAHVRLAEIERLRTAVSRLQASPVWAGVNRRTALGTTLRSTNLFADEERYRHVAELWRQLVTSWNLDVTAEAAALRAQQWCGGFVGYCSVLVARAFDELGATHQISAQVSKPARYMIGGTKLTLRPDLSTGTFLVEQHDRITQHDRPVLRIVPLPHPLTASRAADATSTVLSQLTAARPTVPTLVLYPGSHDERQKLPFAVRLRAYQTPATPAPGHGAAMLWPLPVSPLEIDSVLRLARTLRWFIEQPRLTSYPYIVACGPSTADELSADIDWLARVPDGVAVVRVPAAYELTAAEARIMANRYDTTRLRRLGSNAAQLDRLWKAIERAAADTVALTWCPRCGAQPPQPERALEPRADNSFRVVCTSCHAAWESRHCRSCNRTYPILEPAGSVPDVLDGDRIDRRYGTDLLAIPCTTRDRVFVCPWCATCANDAGGAGCSRCAPSAVVL